MNSGILEYACQISLLAMLMLIAFKAKQ